MYLKPHPNGDYLVVSGGPKIFMRAIYVTPAGKEYIFHVPSEERVGRVRKELVRAVDPETEGIYWQRLRYNGGTLPCPPR